MTIVTMIEAHRQAVLADEANFTDDGKPIDEAAARASQIVEILAFQALMRAQCKTPEEVQAKVGYILHGTVCERTLIDSLLSYHEDGTDNEAILDGQDMVEIFLRSLACPTNTGESS